MAAAYWSYTGQNLVASVSVSGTFAARIFFFSARRLRRTNARSFSTETPVAVSCWAKLFAVGAARATTTVRHVSILVVKRSPCMVTKGWRLGGKTLYPTFVQVAVRLSGPSPQSLPTRLVGFVRQARRTTYWMTRG